MTLAEKAVEFVKGRAELYIKTIINENDVHGWSNTAEAIDGREQCAQDAGE